MGYLVDLGNTLGFVEVKGVSKYIKEHGILQFIQLLKKYKDHKITSELKWGYEIESHVLVTGEDGNLKLYADFDKIHTHLDEVNKDLKHTNVTIEAGAWMIEMTPRKPYTLSVPLSKILEEMKNQLKELRDCVLGPGFHLISMPVFPKLAYGDFYVKPSVAALEYESEEMKEAELKKLKDNKLIDDYLTCCHPRFPAMIKITRERRGEDFKCMIPIFLDQFTSLEPTKDQPDPGFIHLDAATHGQGNCCFQITYSARDMNHARHMYDMFAVLSPLLLPVTAGSAVFHGRLADIDIRMPVNSGADDDRTPEERDPNHKNYIPRSRDGPISFYISNSKMMKDEYNDYKFPVNKEIMKYAKEAAAKEGIELDDRLLQHLGFMYSREPIIVFKDAIELDDTKTTAHFENIQSTNWNCVRFKPPPSFSTDPSCVWRVEMRTPEIGLTEKDNIAVVAIVNMFMQVISYDKAEANFYIPITYLDENFERAYKRDAINSQKFWVRRVVLPEEGFYADEVKTKYIEVTMKEFFYGSTEHEYKGFLAVYDDVIEMMIKEDPSQKEKLEAMKSDYLAALEPILKRVKGELLTTAGWIRQFVLNHPKYKHDSIVPEEVCDELNKVVLSINEGKYAPKDLVC